MTTVVAMAMLMIFQFVIHCSIIQFVDYADSNASTGLCYGKLEAGILTFVIPGLLLGHLVSQKPLRFISSKSRIAGICCTHLTIFVVTFYVQSGLMDNSTKTTLLGVWMLLFMVFAARKFQQPIKVKSLPMIPMYPSFVADILLPDSNLTISFFSLNHSGRHWGQICFHVQRTP